MNIIEYARSFPYTFSESPFSEVDSLVLSQLAYLNLGEMAGYSLRQMEDLIEDPTSVVPRSHAEDNLQLLEAVGDSVRFGNLRLLGQESVRQSTPACQFNASAWEAANMLIVVYRGTDGSLIGWRENFDFLTGYAVRAHALSVDFLERWASKTDLPILVCGHSKGGHLALYAAAHCAPQVFDRIRCVYNHDGPGITSANWDKDRLDALLPRMHRTVPEASVFGLMLEDYAPMNVVVAQAQGLMQHYPYTWQIEEDGRFARGKTLSKGAKLVDSVLEDMKANLTDEDRQELVDALFGVLEASGVEMLADLESPATRKLLVSKGRELPPQTRKRAWSLLRLIVAETAGNAADYTSELMKEKWRKMRQARAARKAEKEIAATRPADEEE